MSKRKGRTVLVGVRTAMPGVEEVRSIRGVTSWDSGELLNLYGPEGSYIASFRDWTSIKFKKAE